MRSRLNKPQRVALLAALAFVMYLGGTYVTTRGGGGWTAYAPNTGAVFSGSAGMSAESAVAVWTALAVVWLAVALWLLAGGSSPPGDADG